MRKYKIVEMKNGIGNLKFKGMKRYGWGRFGFWLDYTDFHYSMKEIQSVMNRIINNEKSKQQIKVKEYIYTPVPDHVPEEQSGKFMEIKNKQ